MIPAHPRTGIPFVESDAVLPLPACLREELLHFVDVPLECDQEAGLVHSRDGANPAVILDNFPFSTWDFDAQVVGRKHIKKNLFVADSEVSGVRVISGINTDHPEVGRIVGQGLFKFGDIDGTGADVRLQHCLGLAYGGGKLFIADTYNNKIKVCDPNTLTVKTFAGDGKPGSGDESPRFYQPGGLSVAGDSLYVADTNNHKIRVIDINSGAVRAFEIAGLNAPRSEKVSATQAD